MTLSIRFGWFTSILAIFLLAVASTTSFAFPPVDDCPPPFNVTLISQTGNSVSFSWECEIVDAEFQIWYQVEGEACSGPLMITPNKFITITNLSAGNYTFYFVTKCGTEISGFVIYDDLIM